MYALLRSKNCYHHTSEPLPKRVPRNKYRLMRDTDTSGDTKPSDATKPDLKLSDESEFEVPKDFPYKTVGNLEEMQELDPLTSKVLEDELQNIMIKIWQDLPDEAPTEAERVVAEGFRNEAGDDLRNMLGLNITKRLLNTFNPLMVKVDFNEKPTGDSFRSFLKWLGCVAMKRVRPGGGGGGGAHTYVAQLRKVADLDRVCQRANVRIRELKAKITPCYNFTLCPPNVRTVYKEPERSTPLNQATGSESAPDKSLKKDTTAKQEDKTPNENQNKKVDEPTDTNKATEKPKTNEEVKKSENKPIVQQSDLQHEFKMPEVPKLFRAPTKVEQKNVANVAKTAQAKIVGKPAVNKAPAPPKPIVAKTIPKTEAPKKVLEQKPTIPLKKDAPKTTVNKPFNKLAPKTSAKTKLILTKMAKKSRKESDFDELDDEDILALMSNAIVIDECKGSDDEA